MRANSSGCPCHATKSAPTGSPRMASRRRRLYNSPSKMWGRGEAASTGTQGYRDQATAAATKV
eukprot:8380359-Alexandrium_andersonii.AAC.1